MTENNFKLGDKVISIRIVFKHEDQIEHDKVLEMFSADFCREREAGLVGTIYAKSKVRPDYVYVMPKHLGHNTIFHYKELELITGRYSMTDWLNE